MQKQMNLNEIQKFQKEFDEKFFSKYWEGHLDMDRKLEFLKDFTIALTGELGEFANLIKKANRDRRVLEKKLDNEMIEKLKEELTDCFIYMIILSTILDMDVEKEYLKKLKFNKKRFEKYAKN